MSTPIPIYRPHAGPRPFRFGVNVKRAGSLAEWQALARKIEDLGYATLFVGDHIRDQWGPLVGMTAAADATTSLRVGTSVLNNDLRNPVMLAQEIATLDVVSGGRAELGVGAGYNPFDYAATGIALDPPPARIERLHEAVQIMKRYWRDGTVDFAGNHFTIEGALGYPRPVTSPWPPLCIGGGGRKVLTVAGREADIVSLSPNLRAGSFGPEAMTTAGHEAFVERVGWVRDAAGERFPDIELHVSALFTGIGRKAAALVERLGNEFGLTEAEVKALPIVLAGSVDEACDTLHRWREEYGITYVSVADYVNFAPVVAKLVGTARTSDTSLRGRVQGAVGPVRSRLGAVKRRIRPPAPRPVRAPVDGNRPQHRVLMVGAGGMGEIWLRKYVPTAGSRLVVAGLVDVDPVPLQSQGDLLGVAPQHRYRSIDDAFAAVGSGSLEDVDACFVVIPPAYHREAVEGAAGHGLHVLCEKPIADTWEDCARTYRAVREAGVKAQVIQNYRYIGTIQAAKEVLDSGVLGPIAVVAAWFAADYRERNSWGAPFRHQMRHPLLLEAAAHHLDQIRHLSADDVESITAMDWRPDFATGFDGEPCALVHGSLVGGGRFSYEGNAVAAGPELSWRSERYRVECAHGTLVVDDEVAVTQRDPERGLAARPVPVRNASQAGHPVMLSQFLDWLDGGPEPPTSITDNIKTAAALFAAVESAESGRTVAVAPYLTPLLRPVPAHVDGR